MSPSLIHPKSLSVDSAVEAKHQQALDAALNGDYDKALGMFDGVLSSVQELPPELDSKVQESRVKRDFGFTYLRQAIKNNSVSDVDMAEELIQAAADLTFTELSRLSGGNNTANPPILRGDKRRELVTEHGATQSLIGRLATVKQVVFGSSQTEASPIYEAAQANLISGTNVYYLVSNALHFARDRKINNDSGGVKRGVEVAVAGLAIMGVSDPRNLPAAVKTLVSRVPDLRSRERAIKSVKAKP